VLVILATQFPDVHLSMIGPDKGDGSRHSVHQLANDLRIGQLITFRGPVPKAEVPFWLNQGDIFINTTNIDNTPVSVMEAMACGLCIVSTDVGGMQYLLTHEHDALLVPANDPNAMAGAVRRILTEPGLAEHLSRNARKKAEQYDWSIILPQWEALLLSIIEQSEYALKNELVS
jgi:glycosyltransferase involved in cell wall biosynthesis